MLAMFFILATIPAALLGAAMVRQNRAPHADAGDALVGTWRLVSVESRTASGENRRQLGRAPAGQLVYDAAGHMSAQLMEPDRPRFGSSDRTKGTDAEVRAAFAGYIAYYGTYTLDLSQHTVTHHVEGARCFRTGWAAIRFATFAWRATV